MPKTHNQKIKKLQRIKMSALEALDEEEYQKVKDLWPQVKANHSFAGIGIEGGAKIQSADGSVYTIQPNGSMRSDQRPHLRKKQRREQKLAFKQMIEATKGLTQIRG